MVGSADIPEVAGIEGLSVVGRGGFATVYRGRQPAFHRDVAVKVLQRSELDTDDRRRFERECQAMGALSNHPAIVTLYDAGFTADERPYLVMSFVADGSLQDRLSQGPIPWRDVSVFGVRLAGALETAHRAGVIHRDVKPANVLRSAYGEQLTDFGIARLQGGHETLSGVITASVAHAAPEILDGESPDARADVYSLGSTLYASLAGSAAYVRGTDEGLLALIHRVGTAPLPDLRQKGIPDPLASVVETAMAKDPAERYETAEDFGHALCDAQSELGLHETDLMIVGSARDRSQPTAHATRIVTPRDGDTARPTPPPDPPTTQLPSRRTPVPPPVDPNPADARSPDDDRSPARWVVPLAVAGVAVLAGAGFLLWPDGGDTADPPPETAIDSAPATAAETDVESTTAPATEPTNSGTATTVASTASATTVPPPPVDPPTESAVVATMDIAAGEIVAGEPFTGIDGIAFDPFRERLLAAREPAPPDVVTEDPTLMAGAVFSVPLAVPTDGPGGTLGFGADSATSAMLLRGDGTPYGTELDVEGMAVLPDGSFYIASEGESDRGDDVGFFVHRFGDDGRFRSELQFPDWYLPNDDGSQGFTPRRGPHGIDVRPNSTDEVIVAVEAPLVQDYDPAQPTAAKVTRLVAFDIDTGQATREWGYPLEAIPDDSIATSSAGRLIVDLAVLEDGTVVVLESEPTANEPIYTLYRVTLDDGVAPSAALPPVVQKSALEVADGGSPADLSDYRSLAGGPVLDDGRASLILASDNAFENDSTDATVIAVGADS